MCTNDVQHDDDDDDENDEFVMIIMMIMMMSLRLLLSLQSKIASNSVNPKYGNIFSLPHAAACLNVASKNSNCKNKSLTIFIHN